MVNVPELKTFEVKFRQTATAALGSMEVLVTRRFEAAYHQLDGQWLILKNALHKPIFQVQQHLVETIEEIHATGVADSTSKQ